MRLARLAHPTRRNRRRGVVLVLVAICLLVLLGMLALVIDGGRAATAYRELQASSDAAATAGAQALPDTTAAKAMALEFSAVALKKNWRADLPGVSMSPGYPLTRCLTSIGLPCEPANAIVVRQQADIPSLFAWALGMGSLHVSTTATASMRGGAQRPMDVMVIIDVSASMASNCTASGTGVSSPKRVDCAKAGIRAFLNEMWPCQPGPADCSAAIGGRVAEQLDKVGLMIYPGVQLSSDIPKEFDCTGNNIGAAEVAPYNSSPIYTIDSLSSDYKTANNSALNGAGSNLVKAADWGSGNTCSGNSYPSSDGYGVEAKGGVSTYFADAISQAQTQLVNAGRPNVQKVIILLSDGEGNTYTSDPCQDGINAAGSATAAGTWVYAIAYGSSTTGMCTPATISGYDTMYRIASDPAKFFYQPDAADLTAIFPRIAIQLTTTRLLNDSTQ